MGDHIQLSSMDDLFFYKNILETVSDGIWVTDKHDNIIFFNPGMEKIAGVKNEDCIGANVLTGFPRETNQEFEPYYLQAKNSLEPVFYEAHVKTPAGKNTVQQGWLTPIIKNDEYQGIICTIHDITEKKKAEDELKETLDATTDGIWTWNFKTDTMFFSDRYYQMLGYEPQEFDATFENWTNLLHPEDKEKALTVSQEYLKHKPDSYENSFRLRTKQGGYRWFQSKAKVVERDADGEAIRMIGNHEDITKIKEAEEKLHNIMDSTYDFIMMLDDRLKIQYINRAEQGLNKDDLLNIPLYNLVDKADQERVKNHLENILKNGSIEHYETIFLRPNNEMIYYESIASPIKRDGAITGVIVNSRDITEKKKTNQLIEISEQKYRLIFEMSPIGITTADKKGIILDINQSGVDITGHSREEIIGKSYKELNFIDHKMILKILKDFPKIIRGKPLGPFEVDVIDKKGNTHIVEVRISPIRNNGKFTGTQVTMHDITEKKNAEKELKQSEQKYRGYIDNAPNGVFICDETGRYLEVNDQVVVTTGYSKDELLHMTIADMIPEEGKERGLQHFQTLIKDGKSIGEAPFIHKDGSLHWWQVNSVKLSENRFLGFTQDITEKVEVEQKLQRIFNMSSELICEADINTATFTKINPSFMNVLGYSEEELLSHSFLEFIHPDDIEPTQTVIDEQLQRGEKVLSFINRYRCKDGSYIWLDWNSHPVPEKGFLYAIARDITDEKIKEKEIINSKKETEMILNTAGDGIRLVNKDYKILSLNDTFAQMVGLSKDEIIGRNCSEVFKSVDCGTENCPLRRVLQTGEGFEEETIRTTLDNREIQCILKVSPYRDENDEIVGVIEDFRDITELKQSQAKFRNIFENKGTATGTFGRDHVITQCNSKFVKQSGYSKDEIIGKMHWYDFVLKDDLERMMKFHRQRSEGGNPPGEYECHMVRKNGEIMTMIVHIGVIPHSDERIVSLVDITKQKTVEHELENLNKNLEEEVQQRTRQIQMLLKQKDEFINQLGHDIKNPLGPLVNLLPLLEKNETDPKQKEMIQVMNRNVTYIKNLVTRTIQLAQLKSPSKGLHLEEFDLGREIQDILITHKLHFDEKQITVDNKIPQNIMLNADRLKIQEVINNLLNNAVKYNMQGGSITIDQMIHNNMITISINDTGIGMQPEQLQRVFDEFYKADSSRHDFDSSGLGMAITKRIIEMHGGKIWVESDGPGKGSTFYITLKKELSNEG